MHVGQAISFDGFFSWFKILYLRNDGAAYSILQGKQNFLVVFTILFMIFMIAYYVAYRKKMPKLEKFTIALILGGGIGNLIDRLLYSYVIDFIDISIIPVFNVADIAVTCGCGLFLLITLTSGQK